MEYTTDQLTGRLPYKVADRLAQYKAASHVSHWKYSTWKDAFLGQSYRRDRSNVGTWQPLEDMKRFASPSDRAYYCDNIPAGLRNKGDMGDILKGRNQATGYYSDNFQSATYIGFVLQLPGRNGQPIYIPAVRNSDYDGITLWPLDHHAEVEDAARSADHYAERYAKDAREYDAKFQAEQQIENARETIEASRLERRSLLSEMRALRAIKAPKICAALWADIRKLKNDSAEAYKRIETLTDNPWESVS